MKNLRSTRLAIMLSMAFFLVNAMAFANTGSNDELVKVTETGNMKLQVNQITNSLKVAFGLMLNASENVKLSIKDADNNELYSTWHRKTNGFIQTFDFSNLEDGEYTFEIRAGKESLSDKVVVKEKKTYLPTFSAYISDVEDNKVKFSYFAPDNDVHLVLKNAQGEQLYDKKVGSGYNASGIANLSKLEGGTYTLEIKNGDNVESKEITIQ